MKSLSEDYIVALDEINSTLARGNVHLEKIAELLAQLLENGLRVKGF